MLKLRKSKSERGITLIALIITVVVLMILATVAITSIQNDGIIAHAQNAVDEFGDKQAEEQSLLNNYLAKLEEELGGGEKIAKIVDKDGNDVKNVVVTSNTEAYDEYGNKIVIPAGFKIRVDATTNNASHVTEGIVIEDGTKDAEGNATATTGNQFVWIPVGTINHLDDEGNETTTNITLGRYTFSTSDATDEETGETIPKGTPTLHQPTADNPYTSNVAITSGSYNYTEYQSGSTTPTNAIARNINYFYESVIGTESKEGNGGYYLGRYEAGDSSKSTVADRTGTSGTSTAGTLVCKANQVPYNWILQADASDACKSMYADGYKADGTGTFSSDLINSYAWDTAIIFIQTFGTKDNSSTYASTVGKSSVDTSSPQLTGTNRLLNVTNNPIDEQLNIYDMAGNCYEWSTETYSSPSGPCLVRGGVYDDSRFYTRSRSAYTTTSGSGSFAVFRPLLYVGL